jgi:RNA 2',3'-cyclic 3'-phosphodiesterase
VPSSSRLFVAVWPPPAFAAQLASLPRPEQRGVRWTPPEHWHVTLRFLGEADPEEVGTRLDDAALVSATATLGPVVQRLGRGLVVVPVTGLDQLAGAVADVTSDIGQPIGDRGFRGHVTLARFRPSVHCPLAGTPVYAVGTIEEIVLAQSRLSPAGATYERVRRWRTG